RGVDVAGGNLLGNYAHAGKDFARKTSRTHLQALEIRHGIDFLAVPATHLSTGVTQREVDDVALGEQFTHERHAFAFVHPGVHLAGIQTERNSCVETEGRVLPIVVVGSGLTTFNSTVAHSFHDLEARDDFPRRI